MNELTGTIAELYWKKNMTLRQIGNKLGCSHEWIRKLMTDAHIELRPVGKRKKVKV